MNKFISLLGILLLSLILIACGDIGWDMVISSAGTYQVSALVNEVSLDTCSLVGQGSDVYPYFKNSLVNDPDVRGLLVFLQDSQGEQVSGKFHYSISAETKEETPAEELRKAGETGEETPPVVTEFPEEFIRVDRLDQRLPVFIFPEDLPIGYYTIVFQVLGQKEVLYRTEKSVYYIADAQFELTDLQSYLPDVLAGGHLASPGDNILLEALVDADERLSPYAVWYSGRQSIAEGYVSEGAARFMWKVPEQAVFHTLRVEVFPIMPNERIRRNITGKTKELLFPVSIKNERKKTVDEEREFAHWYDLGGTLRDVYAPDSGYDLVPVGATVPNWKPHAGLYGLSLAEGDQYELPVSFAALNPQEQGRGRLKLQFAPWGTGRLVELNLDLADASDSESIAAAVSLTETNLVLSLERGTERLEALLELEPGDYSSVFFDYTISGRRLEIGLAHNSRVSLELDLDQAESPASFTGTGTLRLGSASTASPDENTADKTVVIINELRTRYDITALSTEAPQAQEGETIAVAEPAAAETAQTTTL
ncbi:MAG: hypothetical protein LBL19_07315 [Spirochaetaceae bacterium]|jgi:hypothetical protein|nr:hypothetical protein [Spirochaetaceae bacterium]